MPGLDRNDALRELGNMAAERREGANMTLEDVYDRTRIRMEYLRGIEAGNYEGFPEPVYIKGFIRTYLRLIGAEDLQADFMAQLDRGQPQRRETSAPNLLGNASQGPKGFKPASHVWLFMVLILALAGTGVYVWYAWSNGTFDIGNLRWPNFMQSGTVSTDTQQAAQPGTAQSETPKTPEATEPPKEENTEPTPTPTPTPEPKKKSTLSIQARGDVWMSVSIGETSVFNRTLKKGDTAEWELTAPARVRFGRPDMANVTLNGKDLGLANAKGSKKAETYIYQPDGTYKKAEGK